MLKILNLHLRAKIFKLCHQQLLCCQSHLGEKLATRITGEEIVHQKYTEKKIGHQKRILLHLQASVLPLHRQKFHLKLFVAWASQGLDLVREENTVES